MDGKASGEEIGKHIKNGTFIDKITCAFLWERVNFHKYYIKPQNND